MFLDLSKNKLKNLPDEIGECVSLSDLYLSENQIYELPETIGVINNFEITLILLFMLIGRLSSLTILKLDVNDIQSIPFSIGG